MKLTNLKQRIAAQLPPGWRPDPHLQEVMTGAGTSLAWRLAGTGISFAFNVLIARVLGAHQAGIYFLALTITLISSVIGRMGLDNSLLRFTAVNAALGDWVKVAGVYRRGLAIAVGLSAGVSALLFFGADWVSGIMIHDSELANPLRVMSLSIVPFTLVSLYGELLRATKRVGESTLIQAVSIPLMSLILLALIQGQMGPVGVCVAYTLSSALVMVVSAILWRRAVPQTHHLRGDFDNRLLISASLPLFWTALMQIMMNMAGSIALGIWADSAAVAIFNVAYRAAALTSFVLIATNSIAAPKFAALHAQGDHDAMGKLARSSARLMLLAAAPVLLIMLAAPAWVMGLFGSEFQSGWPILAILTVGQFINVVTGSVGFLLMMTGHEKATRNKTSMWAALYMILLAALVPVWGLTGAAIATMLVVAGDNLTGVWLVYRFFSIMTLPIPAWSGGNR